MSIAVPMDALRADSKTVRSGPRQNEKWRPEVSKKNGGQLAYSVFGHNPGPSYHLYFL